MGYTADFVGHIDIAPALNEHELHYLSAFSTSRRRVRPGGPYDVPGESAQEDLGTVRRNAANIPPDGQPSLWCDWVPCWDGCCLIYDGGQKSYGAATWLRYLIDHFLKPGAHASRRGDPRFAGFTFDHVLEGMVVGCRRDNKELFMITVAANGVGEQILRRADRRYRDYPPLPYEEAIDRELTPSRRRRRDREGQVLPFTRPSRSDDDRRHPSYRLGEDLG